MNTFIKIHDYYEWQYCDSPAGFGIIVSYPGQCYFLTPQGYENLLKSSLFWGKFSQTLFADWYLFVVHSTDNSRLPARYTALIATQYCCFKKAVNSIYIYKIKWVCVPVTVQETSPAKLFVFLTSLSGCSSCNELWPHETEICQHQPRLAVTIRECPLGSAHVNYALSWRNDVINCLALVPMTIARHSGTRVTVGGEQNKYMLSDWTIHVYALLRVWDLYQLKTGLYPLKLGFTLMSPQTTVEVFLFNWVH